MEDNKVTPITAEEFDKEIYSKIEETLDVEIHPDDEGKSNVLSTLHDYFMDKVSSLQSELKALREENKKWQQDYSDLQTRNIQLKEEKEKQEELLKECYDLVMRIKPNIPGLGSLAYRLKQYKNMPSQYETIINLQDKIKVLSNLCEYQKCPKCSGQGVVSKPPHIAGDQETWSASTSITHICNVCNGAKIIVKPVLPCEGGNK